MSFLSVVRSLIYRPQRVLIDCQPDPRWCQDMVKRIEMIEDLLGGRQHVKDISEWKEKYTP